MRPATRRPLSVHHRPDDIGGAPRIDDVHRQVLLIHPCAMIIRFKADDLVYIKPGDEVLGVRVIGIPPIPIGFDHEKGTV